MGVKSTSLPKGGETIYEVIYVHSWLISRYADLAKGLSNFLFLNVLPKSSHRRYYSQMHRVVRQFEVLLESEVFKKSELARRHMPYGKWVESELLAALFRRIDLITSHPAWHNLTIVDRLRLVAELTIESMFWSAAQRSAVWEGRKIPAEPPFSFIDQWKAKHRFEVQTIATVVRHGPFPSELT